MAGMSKADLDRFIYDTRSAPMSMGALPSPSTSQMILAQKGRNGDAILGHLTPGEVVVPSQILDSVPGLRSGISQAFNNLGADIGQYTVGGPDDSMNPETGMPEYAYDPAADAMSSGYHGGIQSSATESYMNEDEDDGGDSSNFGFLSRQPNDGKRRTDNITVENILSPDQRDARAAQEYTRNMLQQEIRGSSLRSDLERDNIRMDASAPSPELGWWDKFVAYSGLGDSSPQPSLLSQYERNQNMDRNVNGTISDMDKRYFGENYGKGNNAAGWYELTGENPGGKIDYPNPLGTTTLGSVPNPNYKYFPNLTGEERPVGMNIFGLSQAERDRGSSVGGRVLSSNKDGISFNPIGALPFPGSSVAASYFPDAAVNFFPNDPRDAYRPRAPGEREESSDDPASADRERARRLLLLGLPLPPELEKYRFSFSG